MVLPQTSQCSRLVFSLSPAPNISNCVQLATSKSVCIVYETVSARTRACVGVSVCVRVRVGVCGCARECVCVLSIVAHDCDVYVRKV